MSIKELIKEETKETLKNNGGKLKMERYVEFKEFRKELEEAIEGTQELKKYLISLDWNDENQNYELYNLASIAHTALITLECLQDKKCPWE